MENNPYIARVAHKNCRQGIIETSDVLALKLDGDDGLSCALGFENGIISVCDYLYESEHNFIIIEASDLEDSIRECNTCIQSYLNERGVNDISKLPRKDRTTIKRKAWDPITNEFKRKWCGSIAVIERNLRKKNENIIDPTYHYVIVCKNKTDPRMLDDLIIQLKGMMRNVKAATTDSLEAALL